METLSFIIVVVLLLVIMVLYLFLKRALDTNDALSENISILENQNTEALNANAQLDAWFQEFKSRVIYSYQRIKTIDASGHFVADDEVGYFFTELKGLIERLYELGIMDEIEKQESQEGTPKITTEELQKVLSQRKGGSISTIKEKEER